MISFKQLSIPDIILIEPEVFIDDRGFFYESYNKVDFEKVVGREIDFVQDNHSRSKKNVLRGLHYQEKPFSQAKLVKVIIGEIFDVAVDLRPNSKTFCNWVGEILSSENKRQLWIPEGFAHGFQVLSEFAEVSYKVNSYYSKDHERSILWSDSKINIDWPHSDNIIINQKDRDAKSIDEIFYTL